MTDGVAVQRVFHVRAIPPPPPGELDLEISENEEFSPDKLRANLERLYMTVVRTPYPLPRLCVHPCNILPDADVKIYLTASVETRARRRYDELREKGEDCSLEEISRDIKERDERDMTREIAPLKKADDAVLVDSSDMTIQQVVDEICSHCR